MNVWVSSIFLQVYGQCGTHSCLRANAKQCFELLSKNYKFYLAFENANCRDYITEKFFLNALQYVKKQLFFLLKIKSIITTIVIL